MNVSIGENRFDFQDLLTASSNYDAMREKLLSPPSSARLASLPALLDCELLDEPTIAEVRSTLRPCRSCPTASCGTLGEHFNFLAG